jgi:fatty acid desaturase
MLSLGGTFTTEENGVIMTPHAKWAIAGVILGLILFIVSPWAALAVIVLAIGIPTGLYLMLDPSQRRRLKEIRRRQIR